MELLVVVGLSGVVFGGACAILATNKNRDAFGWFVLGFLFSLVALIVIAALSPLDKTKLAGDETRSKRRDEGEAQRLGIGSAGPHGGQALKARYEGCHAFELELPFGRRHRFGSFENITNHVYSLTGGSIGRPLGGSTLLPFDVVSDAIKNSTAAWCIHRAAPVVSAACFAALPAARRRRFDSASC